jgi:actin-related protein 6
VTDTDQILVMNNERFTVPELVFRPDDIGQSLLYLLPAALDIIPSGLDQGGLAEMIVFSISKLPSDLQGMFWSNIGLIGGNTKFKGFRERLCVLTKVHLDTNPELTMKNRISELQTLAPVDCEVVIYEAEEYVH